MACKNTHKEASDSIASRIVITAHERSWKEPLQWIGISMGLSVQMDYEVFLSHRMYSIKFLFPFSIHWRKFSWDTIHTVTAHIVTLCCSYLHAGLINHIQALRLWDDIMRCVCPRKLMFPKLDQALIPVVLSTCLLYLWCSSRIENQTDIQ